MDSLALPMLLRKRFEEAGVRRPSFFIVGAPKCGTTAMALSLARHPDVFMSSPKEPHAFGSDLGAFRQRMEPDDYVELFRGAGSESRLGEASVWYLRSTTAAREIHDFDPDARILVMLRNPVDMLYSLHSQVLLAGIEHIRDFPAALDAETDRRQGRQIRRGVRFPGPLLYSDAVAYGAQLERYFELFDRGRVHVILFEDVVGNSAAVMRDAQRFLDIPIAEDLALLRLNEGHTIRSPRLQRLSKQSALVRLVGRSLVPKRSRARVAEQVRRRVRQINVTQQRRPSLPPELRADLTERFRPQVQRLALLLHRDLSAWTGVSGSK